VYQFLVSFTVQPEHRDDFVRAARQTARDSLANEPGARRRLMRGSLVDDTAA
jgi:quinol monooxygenase YgiN